MGSINIEDDCNDEKCWKELYSSLDKKNDKLLSNAEAIKEELKMLKKEVSIVQKENKKINMELSFAEDELMKHRIEMLTFRRSFFYKVIKAVGLRKKLLPFCVKNPH